MPEPVRIAALLTCFLMLCGSGGSSEPLRISELSQSSKGITFNFPTVSNRTYSVTSTSLRPPYFWDTVTNVHGNGAPAHIHDTTNKLPSKIYRVFAESLLRYLTVGHVGPTTARLAVGLDRAREITVSYSTNADMAPATMVGTFLVSAANDFTRTLDLAGLKPSTTYFFNILVDRTPYYSAPYPTFRTAPPHGTPGIARFAFGSCFIGSTAGGENTAVFRAPAVADQVWRSMAAKDPHFFLHLGDTAYCDNMGATELKSYRLVHRHSLDERLANMSGYAYFRQHFPFYSTWDDHELRNDWPWSPAYSAPWSAAYFAAAKQAFLEYPARGNPDPVVAGELYYSLQFGDVGVFMTDTRSFRSCQQGEDSGVDLPSGFTTVYFNGTLGTASSAAWNEGLGFSPGLVGRTLRLANGQMRHIIGRHSATQISISEPAFTGSLAFTVLGKTILGTTQKQHLKNWLLENKDALRVKFIGTATPIHGLTEHVTAKDAWGAGYQAELNEILDFTVSNQIRNVVFLSGDQHFSGSFNRQRSGINFFEFMSSPLASSFYPRYTGTNATLLSRVNWMFDITTNHEPAQNFGVVTVRTDVVPLTVNFELFDAGGTLLNSTSLREGRSGLEMVP